MWLLWMEIGDRRLRIRGVGLSWVCGVEVGNGLFIWALVFRNYVG